MASGGPLPAPERIELFLQAVARFRESKGKRGYPYDLSYFLGQKAGYPLAEEAPGSAENPVPLFLSGDWESLPPQTLLDLAHGLFVLEEGLAANGWKTRAGTLERVMDHFQHRYGPPASRLAATTAVSTGRPPQIEGDGAT